jgi:hypothetical protein
MLKRWIIRNILEASYTLAITAAVGKWAIHAAYLERGYKAVGGEFILIPMTCWVAYKAIHHLFNTLEEVEHERNERRSRAASGLPDNR